MKELLGYFNKEPYENKRRYFEGSRCVCSTYIEGVFINKIRDFVYSLYIKNLGQKAVSIKESQKNLIDYIKKFDNKKNAYMNEAVKDITKFLNNDFIKIKPYFEEWEAALNPYRGIYGEFSNRKDLASLLFNFDDYEEIEKYGYLAKVSGEDFAKFIHSALNGPILKEVENNCLNIKTFKITDLIPNDFIHKDYSHREFRLRFSKLDNTLLFYSSRIYKPGNTIFKEKMPDYGGDKYKEIIHVLPDIIYFLSSVKFDNEIPEFNLIEKTDEMMSHTLDMHHGNPGINMNLKTNIKKMIFASAFLAFDGAEFSAKRFKNSYDKLSSEKEPASEDEIILPHINYKKRDFEW